MDEIDENLATLQYLKKFEDKVQSLIVELRQRYADKPKEPARIVCNVVATICARLIIGTSPVLFWKQMFTGIANALEKEIKKEKEEK